LLNPLFRLAVLSGAEAAIRLHAKRCDNIDACGADGRSLLLLAVMNGNLPCCEVLLEAGANPKLTGADGLDASNLAVRNGRGDLAKLIARYLPSTQQDPEPDEAGGELWIEEPESSVPQHDLSCIEDAIRLQETVCGHVFIDDVEDWSDVEVELPEVRDYGGDVDDQLLVFLNSAMRTGRSSYVAIDDLAMDVAGEDEAPATASRLLLLLGDLGVIVDETGPLLGHRAGAEDRLGYSLLESLDFLRDLGNPIVDPYNCFVRDIGRHRLLSPEREVRLATEIEQGFERAAQELSSCSPAISEILRVADAVINGEMPIEAVVDADRARRRLSDPNDLQQEQSAEKSDKDALTCFAAQIKVLRRLSRRGPEREVTATLRDLHLSPRLLEHLARVVAASGHAAAAEVIMEALKAVEQAIDEFFHCNIRLVFQIARRYVRVAMPLNDLVQEGSIGLLKAIRRFDWRRGYRFSTYATWWIRQTVTRAIANDARLIRLPVHVCEAMRVFTRTTGKMRQEFGREPACEEVADRLEWPVGKVYRYAAYVEDPVSLGGGNIEEGTEDVLDFAHAGDLLDELHRRELSSCVESVLRSLTPREAEVIRARFGIGADDEQTLEQIGTEFGVTRERIRQIEAKALKGLRHPGRRAILQSYAQDGDLDALELTKPKPNRSGRGGRNPSGTRSGDGLIAFPVNTGKPEPCGKG
jgi:RNA polymerase primary sigma factor